MFGIENPKNKELILSETASIKSILEGKEMEVVFYDTTSIFAEEELDAFQAIVFIQTSGEVLDDVQRADVERFVQAGGKILGIGALPEVPLEWPWYSRQMEKSTSILDPAAEDFQSTLESMITRGPLDYSLASTQKVPEENRFQKEVLDFNLNEPMELDEIKGKGILFIERRGSLKLFDFSTQKTKQVGTIPVTYINEDGLLGLAIDPNFAENNWIYLFYSAPTEDPIQHVSRFNFENDSLDLASEKILLEIPTIRKCCHSGGALEFGPKGNLFITLGDNTNPFQSSGYAPIDERPDRALWDAQKSAANTNDLRGKILRIKPEDDGTYSIPDGNLFPPGTPDTRPEIYVMGCRNPFRHSIDSKTGYLYWGDVGPDAGKPDSTRGPDGMGEFDQARAAGFWGWPYTRGNNQAYFDYDFETKKSGKIFDPKNIINDSPNNTGIKELPPVQESMIWFGYGQSEEFPWLGKGGINPMAGPVFHAEDYGKGFPDYFENKLFVYEWMRDWIYIVTLDENQNYVKSEAFMPNTEFSHPMDMMFGQDGMLYILEYGQKWNKQNLDARLSRVKYIEGNREPVARILADRNVGAAPLTVNFSGEKSIDFDKDKLKYEWSFDQNKVQSKEMNPSFTFEKEGIYTVTLTVSDKDKAQASMTEKIMVGNELPELSINTDASKIYWDGKTVDYSIQVNDKEDGNTDNGSIKAEDVKVTFTYLPEGEDIVLATIGHQQSVIPEGLKLINGSDCKACHAANEKVNGPSYEDIANKYTSEDKTALISSIIKGSSGIWGETMMSAHPQLKVEEVAKIVDYIFTLRTTEEEIENLPLKGTLTLDEHMKERSNGKYILMASYVDKGNPSISKSNLSISDQLIFRTPRLEAENADEKSKDLSLIESQGEKALGYIVDDTYMMYEDVRFDGLKEIQIGALFDSGYKYWGVVEFRIGSKSGQLVGAIDIELYNVKRDRKKSYSVSIDPVVGNQDLFVVFRNEKNKEQFIMNADYIFLKYEEL